MDQQDMIDEMIANPIIAAVRSRDQLDLALQSPVTTIFLLSGSINTLGDACQLLKQSNRRFFIHVDLLEGLRPDQQGLRFVAEQYKPTGIITTKPSCAKWAQNLGLMVVQRIFVLDSTAITDGISHIEACKPNLVEVMPGVSEKVIQLAVQHFNRPLIAGGLINTREEVIAALGAGALAVSTGTTSLWNL